MRANCDRFVLGAGQGFWRQDASFFDSASSRKWEGVLAERNITAYEAAMASLLTEKERGWLENGTVAQAARLSACAMQWMPPPVFEISAVSTSVTSKPRARSSPIKC